MESKGEDFNFSLLKPKHSKKDYESIPSISVEDIINSATIAPKKQKLHKEKMSFDDIVKISEKKKQFKKKK
jgi:hypothetical protein